MSGHNRLNDEVLAKVAVANSAGVGAGAELVSTAIDATGYSRARFVFSFGTDNANTGSLSTGVGVWHADASGGTYARIASASGVAVTSGVISSAAKIIIIDVPTSNGTPWLKFSGSFMSTAVPHSCIVELYNGIRNPPTSVAQQLITV